MSLNFNVFKASRIRMETMMEEELNILSYTDFKEGEFDGFVF